MVHGQWTLDNGQWTASGCLLGIRKGSGLCGQGHGKTENWDMARQRTGTKPDRGQGQLVDVYYLQTLRED